MAAPRVSVIVPVRNRRELLAALLDALDAQTFTDFEVIVIDDGSTDGAGDLAESRTIAGEPVRVLRQQGLGAVTARTNGVAQSEAPILAFTDSDCVPDPQWLEALVAAIDEGAAVAHGLTIAARPLGPLERTTEAGWEGMFPTCNIAYLRKAFDAVGGFDGTAADRWGFRIDERARGLGFGEDTLLGWNVVRRGEPVRYVAGALVRHHVFPADVRESFSRAWHQAAFPALVKDVPELRHTMVRGGVFFAGRSRVPVYATAALALTGRRRLATLAAAGWIGLRARELWRVPGDRSRNLSYLPLELVLDAVTAAAFVVGSARAHTVIL
jgi:glycosyltransferase involved in cell wall biosynthesis